MSPESPSHAPGSLKPMYETPRLFAFVIEPDSLLCGSNVGGSNEEYTYEDWNNLIKED
ncbi:MAG: hypothetical protein IJQ93_07235 [Bacteroidales bacterium]|nr:hypothetical protein [Bacteroidales bacterium]